MVCFVSAQRSIHTLHINFFTVGVGSYLAIQAKPVQSFLGPKVQSKYLTLAASGRYTSVIM